MLRKIGAAARLLGDFAKRAFVHVESVTVADADGVDQRVSLLGSFNRLVDLLSAGGKARDRLPQA